MLDAETTTTGARVRRPRISLWALRVAATLHLLAVVAQPIAIGRYLDGNVTALDVHATVGSSVGVMGMVLAVIAVCYVVGGGALWVLPFAVLLVAAEITQIALGYARRLSIHIPLGVTIVSIGVAFAIWSWQPKAGRSRHSDSPRAATAPESM
jgi:hypothetical protein